jgi:hypothetical protein
VIRAAVIAAALIACGHPPTGPKGPINASVIIVKPNVKGAQVIMDGNEGLPMVRRFPVRPGAHRIEVRAEDHFTRYLEVELAPNETKQLDVELAPVLP